MDWGSSFMMSLNLIIFWETPSAAVNPSPIVAVSGGLIQGETLKILDIPVFLFLGIPFAEPPVGHLRFTDPKEPKPWKGIKKTTQYPPRCLQELHMTDDKLQNSEDCLYLNVYTSKLNVDQSDYNPNPVIVHIHGGRFMTGGSDLFDGSTLVALQDCVVVVIQYRLGVAGFLSTGDKWAAGNFGLMDQLAALYWVQRNIEKFAGDMESVTLFGKTSGAVSSSLFSLLEMTGSLFHRVILEDGCALMPEAITYKTTQLAQEASQIGNCNTNKSREILSCLRNKTEDEMRNIIVDVNKKYSVIPVVVDGRIVISNPRKMLIRHQFRKIWYMIGVDIYSIVQRVIQERIEPEWLNGITKARAKCFIDEHLTPLFGVTSAKKIFKEYFTHVTDRFAILDNLIEMIVDALILIPLIQTAQNLRDGEGIVYFYELHHINFLRESSFNFTVYNRLPFFFGRIFKETVKTTLGSLAGDRRLFEIMINHWINFALDGDPNSMLLHNWPVFDKEELYKVFNLTNNIRQKYRRYRMQFWSTVIPRNVTTVLIL